MVDNFIDFTFENASEAVDINETKERLRKELESLAQKEEAICQQEVQRKEVKTKVKRQYKEQLKREEEEKQ